MARMVGFSESSMVSIAEYWEAAIMDIDSRKTEIIIKVNVRQHHWNAFSSQGWAASLCFKGVSSSIIESSNNIYNMI
jgi:hypothetical protein